jgi:hypothetical protein
MPAKQALAGAESFMPIDVHAHDVPRQLLDAIEAIVKGNPRRLFSRLK